MMRRPNVSFAALAGLTLLQALPARAQSAPDSAIETIKKRGSMMVGMATFVPWAMRDTQGNLIGFEVDVANKLATDLGVKLELVPTAWDGIIPRPDRRQVRRHHRRHDGDDQAQPDGELQRALRLCRHQPRRRRGDEGRLPDGGAELPAGDDDVPTRRILLHQPGRVFPEGDAAAVR